LYRRGEAPRKVGMAPVAVPAMGSFVSCKLVRKMDFDGSGCSGRRTGSPGLG